jgi:hypothetical protein
MFVLRVFTIYLTVKRWGPTCTCKYGRTAMARLYMMNGIMARIWLSQDGLLYNAGHGHDIHVI